MAETLLLTGATGQVGAALLPRLLHDPERRVVCLVRARDDAHLAERRAALVTVAGDATRVDVVRGDVTAPGLGLADADRDRLLGEVDGVLHSAAAVRFDLPDDAATAQNFGGTREALAFARALGARLRRFDHVSTAFVAGTRQGRVLEGECDVGQDFRNAYERSKCRAEMLVHAAVGDGLPCAVHRPAIVVGDSHTGETRAFNVLYWPLKLYVRGWWRTFPGRADARVDAVPVDWVADTIVALRSRADTIGRTFHVASGDDAPTVAEVVERVRALSGGPALRYVDQHVYRTWVRPALAPLRLTKRGAAIFRGGNVFMPYFVANPVFDTTGLRTTLGDAGRAPRFLDYVETVMRWAMVRDFGGGGVGAAE